ncbi:aspartate carbamoyltransferase catalytic subunit [Tyzzerella sp. OttesenSCG-928-J15]|nr:aspartate carbamoyltransferase catalytic subunit [Tyzzerella sp. OttesenSCG-928-J15]
MVVDRKDYIGLKGISAEEINYIIETADTMKYVLTQKNKKAPHLQGKSMVILFYENRSRTKVSYELAGQYLSASVVNMNISEEAETPGFSGLLEMGKIIDQMGADFIVIRHPVSGSAKFLSNNVNACVINAGDGINENPSQALLDLMTIKEQKGKFEGLRVAFVGDIMHSREARSNIWGLLKLGASVSIAAPPTLIPEDIASFGVDVYNDAYKAVKDCDVIMSVRMQAENKYINEIPSFNEYKNLFKIDNRVLSYAKDDVIIMHPGPINRGIEIASEVIDSPRCLVNDQISNGVAIRMAMLYILSLRGGMMI